MNYREPREGKTLRERWSDFWFEHVKLIVFIISMAVLVMLLGPFSVFRIAEWVEQAQTQHQMETEAVTMGYVQALADAAVPLEWDDFSRFYHEEHTSDADGGSVSWILPMAEDFEIRISGSDTATRPDFVYLYDMRTGGRMDLRVESVTVFLARHPR